LCQITWLRKLLTNGSQIRCSRDRPSIERVRFRDGDVRDRAAKASADESSVPTNLAWKG
jgi:hypothetical protein